LLAKVNEHVVELVPLPLLAGSVCESLFGLPGLQIGAVPEGGVMVHTTVPCGVGSLALAGLAPMVAVNESLEPGWAGEGVELVVSTVEELASPTVMLPDPLPVP
jgi:hypothetical protein